MNKFLLVILGGALVVYALIGIVTGETLGISHAHGAACLVSFDEHPFAFIVATAFTLWAGGMIIKGAIEED